MDKHQNPLIAAALDAAALPGALAALDGYRLMQGRVRGIAHALEVEAEIAHVDSAALLSRIARELRAAIGDTAGGA